MHADFVSRTVRKLILILISDRVGQVDTPKNRPLRALDRNYIAGFPDPDFPRRCLGIFRPTFTVGKIFEFFSVAGFRYL
jgi:hypothetical protein